MVARALQGLEVEQPPHFLHAVEHAHPNRGRGEAEPASQLRVGHLVEEVQPDDRATALVELLQHVLDVSPLLAPGQLLLKHSVTVEIEGEDKPALTALWLTLIFT